MDRERTKSEIVKLVRASIKPRRRPDAASPAAHVTGDHNVITMGDLNIVVNPSPTPPSNRAQQHVWRDEISAALRLRAHELQLTDEQLIEIARERLGRRVESLAALSARDLGRLYGAMLDLKRPALE